MPIPWSVPSLALPGKVAIITGGGTGMGRSMALEFAKAGADIVVASRTMANLERVATEVRALGRRALAIRTDVSLKTDADRMVAGPAALRSAQPAGFRRWPAKRRDLDLTGPPLLPSRKGRPEYLHDSSEGKRFRERCSMLSFTSHLQARRARSRSHMASSALRRQSILSDS